MTSTKKPNFVQNLPVIIFHIELNTYDV